MHHDDQSLDITFAALGDSTRRAILAKLALGEASVTELAEPFTISLPAISRHLKVLERAGLISRSKEAQWRIEPRGLKEIASWMEDYRRFWEERLDRMQSYVEKLHAEQLNAKRKKVVKKARKGPR
jgi:DNA-binding transcriptional ArsR family regulator